MSEVSRKVERGVGGGIKARFIRVYNIGRFVQVSQLMAYGSDGTNYAYKAPCRCETIYPGTYVDKATDGTGGYYHNARNSTDCFKSGGKRFEFLEIDLREMQEVAGLRCIFPLDNQGQNIGTTIQLLNADNQGNANLVLAQYIVGANEFARVLIDFRTSTTPTTLTTTPISDIIMPKIYKVSLGSPQSVNGIVELGGDIYIVDTFGNCIWKKGETSSPATKFVTLTDEGSRPIGITTDGTDPYITCFTEGKVRKITVSGATISEVCTVPDAYGIYYMKTSQTLYITSNSISGKVYSWKSGSLVILTSSISYPNSITANSSKLYVSSAIDQAVYIIDTTSPFAVSNFISNTDGSWAKINLISPSALSFVPSISTLFISDFSQNQIFSLRIDTTQITCTESLFTLGGTGNGGYRGDGFQGKLADFDGPINLYYSETKGYLYVSDYNNIAVRFLDLYTGPSKIITSTTSIPSWMENNITAFCFVGSDIYYSTATYLYKKGSPIPILMNFTSIVSIAYNTNDSHIYLLDGGETGRGIWKVSITAPYSRTLYTNNVVNPKWLGFDSQFCMYVIDQATLYRKTGSYEYNTLNYSDVIFQISGTTMNTLATFEIVVGTGASSAANERNTFSNYGTFITLKYPCAAVFDNDNNPIFVDRDDYIVYRVDKNTAMLTPIASIAGESYLGLSSKSEFPYVDSFTNESHFPRDARTVKLRNPSGIAIDSSNNLYITSSQQVLKLTYNNSNKIYYVSVLAGLGTDNTPRSSADGAAKYAVLNNPTCIRYNNNNVYVLETNNIRKIIPDQYQNKPTNLPFAPLSIITNYSRSRFNIANDTATMYNLATKSTCIDTRGYMYFVQDNGSVQDSGLVQLNTKDGKIRLLVPSVFIGAHGIAIYNDAYVYIAVGNTIKRVDITGSTTFPITDLITDTSGSYTKISTNVLGYLYAVNGTSIIKYNLKTNSIVNPWKVLSDINSIDSIYATTSMVYIGVTTNTLKYQLRYYLE